MDLSAGGRAPPLAAKIPEIFANFPLNVDFTGPQDQRSAKSVERERQEASPCARWPKVYILPLVAVATMQARQPALRSA